MTQSSAQKKLLVVEDAIEIQVLLKKLLESEGYAVVCANNGQEALDVLAGGGGLPDLILLDLMMPVMDGMQFRDRQLLDPKLARIPVVVMTADGNVEAKSKRVNAAEFLKKPLDVDQLLEVIEKQFR
ncbi:MAG TPA: response regulator [Bdellovibrionales bacterium]|nr:response regulator [Bdellovibrionales bacterium]